jgi:hypothetical protein
MPFTGVHTGIVGAEVIDPRERGMLKCLLYGLLDDIEISYKTCISLSINDVFISLI